MDARGMLGGWPPHWTERDLPQREDRGTWTRVPPQSVGHVDITTLRELLAEQSNMILEAQRVQIARAMDDQDAKVQGRFREVDRKFQTHEDKMGRIETQLADLAKEIREAPRSTTASTRGGVGPDKYRWTLCMGAGRGTPGWRAGRQTLDVGGSQVQRLQQLPAAEWREGA